MSDFAGIDGVSITGSSKFFEPGTFIVRIDGEKVISSQSEVGKRYAISECCIAAFTPGVSISKDANGVEIKTPVSPNAFAVGDVVGWRVDMSKKSALANCKGHGLAVMRAVYRENGKNPDDVTEDMITQPVMDALYAPHGSPAIGLFVKAEAFQVWTRAGKPFTVVKWSDIDAPPANAGDLPPIGGATLSAPVVPAAPSALDVAMSAPPVVLPPATPPPVALPPAAPTKSKREVLIDRIVAVRPDLGSFDWSPYDDARLEATVASLAG